MLILVTVTAAHTVEGNWQVRIKRGFGCWRTFPCSSGPSPKMVIGTQNCTGKQMGTLKWSSLWSWDPTLPRFFPAQQLYSEPEPTLLVSRLWGSPDIMSVKILAQCLAHGWEMWAAVTEHMRMESQMKEEEKHIGDFQGCCLWVRKIPTGSRRPANEAVSIVHKYQK